MHTAERIYSLAELRDWAERRGDRAEAEACERWLREQAAAQTEDAPR